MVERRGITHLLVCKVSITWLDDKLLGLGHLRNQPTDAGWVYRKLRQGQVLGSLLYQFLLWHKAVSVFSRLTEQIEETGLVAHIGIGSNAQVAGNSIGGDEANAIDIGGQLIRIT